MNGRGRQGRRSHYRHQGQRPKRPLLQHKTRLVQQEQREHEEKEQEGAILMGVAKGILKNAHIYQPSTRAFYSALGRNQVVFGVVVS